MRKRGSDCSEVCKYLMLPILPGSISLKVFGLASLSGRHQRQKPFTVYDTAVNYECRLTYSRSRLLRGHARDILPPLSPSQPEIADDNITCWGTFLNSFPFYQVLIAFLTSFFLPPPPPAFFRLIVTYEIKCFSYLQQYSEHSTA